MTAALEGWENFYVIIGSSAGTLIGLMFVVVALVSSTRTETQSAPMRAFASPTIVYFASVLLVSGVMSIPRHSRTSLGSVLMAIGIAGLVYVAISIARMRHQDAYAPDAGDWAWFVVLPAAAYASIALAGTAVWGAPNGSLYAVGGAAIFLLLIGVHNSWDSAVHLVATSTGDRR